MCVLGSFLCQSYCACVLNYSQPPSPGTAGSNPTGELTCIHVVIYLLKNKLDTLISC